jgi:hypothetical protein
MSDMLVLVELRHNSAKLSDRWWWEVVDRHGRALGPQRRLGHGVFPFGWARSEAHAYRQARRMKRRVAGHVTTGGPDA